ncbi:MAG: NAD(P) transhydrogenase subunit beta, partial [uncultured Solirubrobacteraceae bacterium]
ELPPGPGLHQCPLHHRLRAVHRGPAHAARAADGGARQLHRRRRHGDRRPGDPPQPRGGRLRADRRRRGHRHRGRHPQRPRGEDDRDAADGCAVQRRGRRRHRAHRAGGVPRRRRRHLAGAADSDAVRRDRRRRVVLRLDHRLREAPGADEGHHPPSGRQAAQRPDRGDHHRRRGGHRGRIGFRAADGGDAAARRPARHHGRHPDRRRRHAGRHLDAQRLHRPQRGGGGDGARQHGADRGRHAGRRLRLDPDQADGRRHEPLDRERVLRLLRRWRRDRRRWWRRRRAEAGQVDHRGRRGDPALLRPSRGHRPRLWHGGGAGAAHGGRPGRRARGPRRRGPARHPPGGGTHARPHERAAGRSRRAVRQAQGDGRDQRRVPALRRRPDHRRQRRGQPGRPHRLELADLRHADPRRRQGAVGHRPEALDELRLRRHRQSALLRREDADALRRRQEVGLRPALRGPRPL